MSEVSFYKTKETTKESVTVQLDLLMQGVKRGKWKKQIDKYRSTGDSVDKLSLPCFTGSGIFSKRNSAGLITHSGFLIIDIDKVSEPEKVKQVLSQDRFTSFCFLSASGAGVAVVVKIDPAKHLESFKAIGAYYKEEYSINIDQSCKNVDRLRFISFDPDLMKGAGEQFMLNVVNTSRIFDIVSNLVLNAPDGERHHTLLKCSRLMGGYIAGNVISQADAVSCLEQSFTAREYNKDYNYNKTIADGINAGAAQPLHADEVYQVNHDTQHEHNASRKAWGVAMSMNEEGVKYTTETIIETCEELLMNKKKCEQIFINVAAKHVDAFGINNKPEVDQVEYFISSRCHIRNNIVLQMVEAKNNNKWQPVNVDEIFRQSLKVLPKKIQKHASLDRIKSLLRSDFVESYDPFADYFSRLADWDGATDYIDQLANYVKVTDQSFYNQQFKKALVRSIACGLHGIENRIVMVYVGEKQNTGKSTFIRFLSPFKDNYYTESPLQDNKDSRFQLAENFIYNLEELDSLNGKDVSRLKSIISSSVIRERKPYAIQAVSLPRRCNFWGSTNKIDFLTDDINTRWLCFEVADIDWNYKKDIDIDKVWSQAYALFKSGFDYQLSKDEQQIRDVKNTDYQSSSIERDLILQLFSTEEIMFKTNAEIMDILIENSKVNSLNQYAVSRSLAQLGFKKTSKRVGRNIMRGWMLDINYQEN
jgi:hypothetical protein